MSILKTSVEDVIAVTANMARTNDLVPHYVYINTAEELSERGDFGDEISNLLDMQAQNTVYNTPFLGTKPVLQLKYEMSRSESNVSFNEFKQLATVGLECNMPKNVLYADIEFHDPLRPDQPPFYMAATVHFGAISHNEDWCGEEKKIGDLLECASTVYGDKAAEVGRHMQGKFSFRGTEFVYHIEDLSRACEQGAPYGQRSKIISIRYADGMPHAGIIVEGIV